MGFLANSKIKFLDLRNKFPFDGESFDGVFCTGTLHLFSKDILQSIFDEINRVLKPEGKIIIDFAADLKRTFPDDRVKIDNNDPQYKLEDAKKFLKIFLEGYKIKMYGSTFRDDLTRVKEYSFVTEGNFLLVLAEKK